MRARTRVVVGVLTLLLACSSLTAAGPLQDDLKARRARLLEKLGPESMAIFWSAEPKVFSRDVDYEFHQDANLEYLTGITQEDTIVVFMPGARTRREVLFVREPNPRREHWSGHTLTKDEAASESGIQTVYYTSEFDRFVAAMFNAEPYGAKRGEVTQEYDAFFGAVQAGRARLALAFGPKPAPSAPLTTPYEFAARARDRFLTVAFIDADPMVAALRQIKTPFERTLLERSVEISSEAHMAGMRAARPGKFEYEVEAAIEHVYTSNGAMTWGYPSIVGSGPNATILHYQASNRQMRDGELLLVDAAANYRGLTGDITRTYPVNGVFTAAQKDIYSVILAAQDAGMKAAKPGAKTADVERAVEEVVRAGLLKLGLITDASGDQFRTWYTHGICHWIGMDVHDVGDYQRPLEPGMSFVIEPGVYIREQALEALADTPENRTFKEKVRGAVEKYKNIGARVEDSFLLTETGLKRLSAKVPRTIEEIERFMKGDSPTSTRR